MLNYIKEWISHLSKPQRTLGWNSVCPFSKRANYTVIETTGENIEPTDEFDVVIYALPDELTSEQVIQLAKSYNEKFPPYVFLPDPKDKDTDINGVKTNNGRYNFILCQRRDHLEKARHALRKTSYYSHWSKEYLDEILNT